MWQALEFYRVEEKVLAGIKSFYEQSSACVRVAGNMSRPFSVNNGLRQGCGMSLWLFNNYLHGRSSKRGLRKDAGKSSIDN